jgi:hypothetical protein
MFVCSGKVTRRGFSVCGKEHFDEFKKVQQVIGDDWDPTFDVAKILDRSWTNGGLLIVNKKETKQIKTSTGKALTDMQKFYDMCAYQFELGYDLALSPSCNVSESLGFESVLEIYGGR